MAFSRHFLGLERPALHTAAEYLGNRFLRSAAAGARKTLDLTDVILVTPGARAGRRLNELLCLWAKDRDCLYLPPEITTEGRVPELLYSPRFPFASEWVQQLTWAKAIRTMDAKTRADVFPRIPPEASKGGGNGWTQSEWLALGRIIMATYRELAGEALLFSDVAKKAKALSGMPRQEKLRWESLAAIQTRYRELIRERELWDRQTARQVAIDKHECRSDRKIVLVATADLTKTSRLMLNQAVDFAEATDSAITADLVTALVHAPESWSERFDTDGCVLAAAWKAAEINIAHDQIEFAGDFVDQARCVVRRLAKADGAWPSDRITLGCADERVIAPVQRALDSYGVRGRWGVGRGIQESGMFRMLDSFREFVARDSIESVASLLRHPDIENWLGEKGLGGGYLEQLDKYLMEYAPAKLPGKNGKWLGERQPKMLMAAWGSLADLRRLFRKDRTETKSLRAWTEQISVVISEVYGHRTWDTNKPEDRMLAASAKEFRDLFTEQLALPDDISEEMTGDEALELALEFVENGSIAEPADPDAIEILGWLELPLDDAELLVITGMNEGIVPGSTRGDLFLPNSFRQHLNIEDNDHRFAREAHALATIVESDRICHVVVGKFNEKGDPLIPSRLLFTGSKEKISARWRWLLGMTEQVGVQALACDRAKRANEPASNAEPESNTESESHDKSQNDSKIDSPQFGFEYLRPVKLVNRPLAPMSITSFAQYLSCPYRYWLKRILKLNDLSEKVTELRPMTLGNLVHEVVEAFGQGDSKDSTDSDEIMAALMRELDMQLTGDFASPRLPAVEIQIQQMKRRLEIFAAAQAAWAADGWRILATEAKCNDVVLETVSNAVRLSGTIDRIDYRELEDGGREYAILDYKTGQNAKQPKNVYNEKRDEWKDLQLPLYRFIGNQRGWENARVGYITLPGKAADAKFDIAPWKEAEFESAIKEAKRIVDAVADQRFWPPEPPQYDNDDFNRLMMLGVPERPDYGAAL